jgi:hypothetical protein
MPEIDDLMTELRQRIMRPAESGPSKPAPVEAVTAVRLRPATPEPVDLEQRRGSAAVALRRLAHPERDGGVVAEDDPVFQVSQLIRRLSLDMPELLEEVVTLIERRTAKVDERDDGAAPRLTESVPPAAPVRTASALPDDDTGVATVTLRFDTQVLARIDADAKRRGISRTAWLHLAAGERLGEARR